VLVLGFGRRATSASGSRSEKADWLPATKALDRIGGKALSDNRRGDLHSAGGQTALRIKSATESCSFISARFSSNDIVFEVGKDVRWNIRASGAGTPLRRVPKILIGHLETRKIPK